jgi:hypothetical protein
MMHDKGAAPFITMLALSVQHLALDGDAKHRMWPILDRLLVVSTHVKTAQIRLFREDLWLYELLRGRLVLYAHALAEKNI